MVRPIQKLYPLEISSSTTNEDIPYKYVNQEKSTSKTQEKMTQTTKKMKEENLGLKSKIGRNIKIPKRLNL